MLALQLYATETEDKH